MDKSKIPLIGTGKTEGQVANFARKPVVNIPASVMGQMSVLVPNIYYWEDRSANGEVHKMTMAFKHKGMNYGMSYEVHDQNRVRIEMDRKKLFECVKESLDVIVHHGDKILDGSGNIDPRKINDEEALRYRYDPLWDKRVAAFNKIVRVKTITPEGARKLKLL